MTQTSPMLAMQNLIFCSTKSCIVMTEAYSSVKHYEDRSEEGGDRERVVGTTAQQPCAVICLVVKSFIQTFCQVTV